MIDRPAHGVPDDCSAERQSAPQGSTELTVDVTINGRAERLTVSTSMTALDLVRTKFGLLGTRASCGQGVCGACTILVDSEPVASCATFAWDLDGHSVETIEGLCAGQDLSPEQQAFMECGAFQCGFCTAGMIVLTAALLRENKHPSRDEITEWMASNICRCTGYQVILEAVERASLLHATVADR